MSYYLKKAIDNTKNYGLVDTLQRAWRVMKRPTATWKGMRLREARQKRYGQELLKEKQQKAAQQKPVWPAEYTDPEKPLFSILVPLYETDEHFLDELIRSLQEQTFPGWEVCFSDGSKDSSRLQQILQPYREKDPRIRYIADKPGPLGISANTNQAFSIAKGTFVVLGDHDDLFEPDALAACVEELEKESQTDVFYTDEDKTDETGNRFFDPVCKPSLNWPLLHSCNYITHMFVARRTVAEAAGLFREEYNGSQDYDFILRCLEQTDRVVHIPRVLYHWRINSTSTAGNPKAKRYAYDAGARALQSHYERTGIPAKAEMREDFGFYQTRYEDGKEEHPLLSIVVADAFTRKSIRYLKKLLREKEPALHYEILLTDWSCNSKLKHGKGLDSLKDLQSDPAFTLVPGSPEQEDENNLAAYINQAAGQARGEYLCLFSVRCMDEEAGALSSMLYLLQHQEEAGAIGPKLLGTDGAVRHAGVILDKGSIPQYEHLHLESYDNVLYSMQAFAALRKECLLTKTALFRECGGLDPTYRMLSSSIIDYCLKLGERHKTCLYAGDALMYYDPHPQKQKQSLFYEDAHRQDQVRLNEKWNADGIRKDPYYGNRIRERL